MREVEKMKTNIKFSALLLGMFLTLTASGVVAAFAQWQSGGDGSLSSIAELDTDSKAPPLPGSTAITDTTLVWLGGDTPGLWPDGTHDTFLTQPELYAVSSGWQIQLEAVSHNTNGDVDFELTNVVIPVGHNVHYEDVVFPSGTYAGENFQDLEDTTNSANSASIYFDGTSTSPATFVTYGSYFTKAYAIMESYDSNGRDFSSMDGSINFSNYVGASTPGGTGSSVSLGSDSAGPPPSCITSTAGSGTATITINNC